MNGKLAKRIRYAALCMGYQPGGKGRWMGYRKPVQASLFKRMVTSLKRAYKALPYHLRDTPVKEGHHFVLQCRHGNKNRSRLA